MKKKMKVSELANKLNTTGETVRYYTRLKYLEPAVDPTNGYKLYGAREQHRLSFILSSRMLGFTVKDIGLILSESDKGIVPCPLVRKLIEHRTHALNDQFDKTILLKNRMEKAIKKWQKEPNREPTGTSICNLIENFDEYDD
jgi:DNA-binding transcriptional MerR regulator